MSSSRIHTIVLSVTALLAVASWIVAPRLLEHAAEVEPLFFETVAMPEGEAAGGVAYRVSLERDGWAESSAETRSAATSKTEARYPWSHRYLEVLEDGKALRRVGDLQVPRREGRGTFHTNERRVLFSATDNSDPFRNGRRYELRRPRDLGKPLERGLALAFLAVQLALVALVGAGLWRLRSIARPDLPRRRRSRSPAFLLALALLGLFGVLSVVHRFIPESTADVLGEKLNQYRAIEGEIDTVFLGSSKIYRHLDPLVFDRVLAEHGERASAFNLGVPDTRILEVLYFAERLLERSQARPPEARLRRLIVDCQADTLFEREENRGTERVRRWHDLDTLRLVLAEIVRTEDSWPRRLLLFGEHLGPFLYRASLIGRGVDWLASALRNGPRWIDPDRRGFLALDEELADPPNEAARLDLERRFSELHDQVPEWQRMMARLRRTDPGGQLTDWFEIELFRQLQELARRHRVELVFVISPDPVRRPNLVHAYETGVVERLIRFDDPDRYADFYRLENRFDRHHLDAEAARRMTRLLAERLLEKEELAFSGGPAP